MSEFTPITTQEQFDYAIKERLERANKKYEGYISPQDLEKIRADYDKQIADLNSAAEASAKKYANFEKELAERDSRIKGFETASIKTRVAHELGLPYGASEFLKGDDEASIKESAEAFKKLQGSSTSTNTVTPVFRDSAFNETDGVTARFKQMNPKLKI